MAQDVGGCLIQGQQDLVDAAVTQGETHLGQEVPESRPENAELLISGLDLDSQLGSLGTHAVENSGSGSQLDQLLVDQLEDRGVAVEDRALAGVDVSYGENARGRDRTADLGFLAQAEDETHLVG